MKQLQVHWFNTMQVDSGSSQLMIRIIDLYWPALHDILNDGKFEQKWVFELTPQGLKAPRKSCHFNNQIDNFVCKAAIYFYLFSFV